MMCYCSFYKAVELNFTHPLKGFKQWLEVPDAQWLFVAIHFVTAGKKLNNS